MYALIVLINFILICSKEDINTKLGISPEKFLKLSEVAKDVIMMIYKNVAVDFSDGRCDQTIENSKSLFLKVVLSENQEIPEEEVKAYFDINNYSPHIPSSIEFPDLNFDIFGAKDLEEEFKAFAENYCK